MYLGRDSTITVTEFRQLFYCQFEKPCVAQALLSL
jgi:hypothetical protein